MPAVPYTPRVKLRTSSRRLARPRGADGEGSTVPDPEPNMRLSRAILVMLLLHVVAIGGILAFSLIKERGQNSASNANANPNANGAPVEAEESNVPARAAAAAPTPSASVSAAPRPAVHIVKEGDTLMRIANQNGTTVEALVAANAGSSPSAGLHPGQQIKLPDKSDPRSNSTPPSRTTDALDRIEGATAPSPAAAANLTPSRPAASSSPAAAAHSAPPPPADSGKTYLVEKGDSVYSIAQKLKLDPNALLKLNRIADPKSIKPGLKLHLPAAMPHGK